MFAYCLNNPVNGSDPCGTCFHRLDFWNDCAKCGGETIHDKITPVSDAWKKVTRPVLDAIDVTKTRIERMDWKKVVVDTLVTAVSDGAAGATTGFVLGMWGLPFTEGLSPLVCAVIGGISGFVGGLVCGAISSAWEEFQSVEVT